MSSIPLARPFSLDDKYRLEEGTVYLNGTQAFVRLLIDQHRADQRRGLRTAGLVTGYRGSPLAGLDTTIERAGQVLREHDIVYQNGLNEELAATAIFGSQMVTLFPGARYDGVFGMWYGKGPGVDRSGDIFKHANLAGVGPAGGVLALAGDDPHAKSSTIPSASEPTFYDAHFPVLFPGSVQEILDLGLHGYALSRYAGLWVGFKSVTNVCDEAGTAEVAPGRVRPVLPEFEVDGRPFKPAIDARLMTPYSLELEYTLQTARLQAARRYAAANHLNRIVVRGEEDRIGIVAAGKTWFDVRQALLDLGLDDAALRRFGVRLLKVGMLYPLEREIVRAFARGLREIVVLEEKRAFLELFIRDILYHQAERPNVVGKADEEGRPLVPAYGELDADAIARILARRFAALPMPPSVAARVALLEEIGRRQLPLTVARTPYFCSGCPHNTSTQVPQGSVAGGGIGCHTMTIYLDRNTVGVTPMGGEGIQWVGMAPFTSQTHMFQNIGDGTLAHSGWLAIKQAVAAGANITYKILYNGSVAMTGGQQAAGQVPIPALTRELEAEGVRAIAVVTDGDPDTYRGAGLARSATVHRREELDAVQRRLREVEGVSILVYDQGCAAEKRRLRKRGKLADPPMRVVINEAVCEGCGDCGVKSNCLSVLPVDTELGRKTRIHQSSCNKDYSCLQGDCPSFLTVVPANGTPEGAAPPRRTVPKVEVPLPEPGHAPFREGYGIYMTGVGGTGVVTVNAILGTAALLDGKQVRSLDQTGLSQKGGPVVSSLKLFEAPAPEEANRVGAGEADLYLGFDLLGAASPKNLDRAHPGRTRAVVSVSAVPTGEMVAKVDVHYPDPFSLVRTIERHTRPENVYLDAEAIAEALFADHMASNLVAVGAAYQAGLLPLRAESIERAIELNGVAVEMNRQAFRWGRRWVADRAAVEAAMRHALALDAAPSNGAAPAYEPVAGADLAPGRRAAAARLVAVSGAAGEVHRLLEVRVPELVAYQDLDYAREYVDFVREVASAEQAARPGETRLAEAVARYLFKLMAYKDEYEVARLLLRDEPRAEIRRWFPGGARVSYNLHPPLLRALGLERKLRLGPWFRPALVLLRGLKRLRGTPLDLFGLAAVRRVERALVGEYRMLVRRALAALRDPAADGATYETAVALAELPDLVRGYEEVKLAGVERFRTRAAELVARLERPMASTATPAPATLAV